jgi:chromosome segregation ATPase
MGLVIEAVNAGAHREISMLSDLMCNERSALRLTDLACIRSILTLLQDSEIERPMMDEGEAMRQGRQARAADGAGTYGSLAYALYELLVERQRKLGVQMERLDKMAAAAAAHAATVDTIDGQRVQLAGELRQRDAMLDELRAQLQERDAALAAAARLQEHQARALDAERAELATLRAQIRARDAELAMLRSHVSAIEASRAWRVAHTIGTMRRKLRRTPGQAPASPEA